MYTIQYTHMLLFFRFNFTSLSQLKKLNDIQIQIDVNDTSANAESLTSIARGLLLKMNYNYFVRSEPEVPSSAFASLPKDLRGFCLCLGDHNQYGLSPDLRYLPKALRILCIHLIPIDKDLCITIFSQIYKKIVPV